MLVSARALTVLVIAHNDAQNLLATIERIYSALTVTVEEFRIVIFDDGSTDDTAAVARAACEKYPFVFVHRNKAQLNLASSHRPAQSLLTMEYLLPLPS